MAAPIASSAASVPSKARAEAPLSTARSKTPAAMTPRSSGQIGGRRGRARRSPRGRAGFALTGSLPAVVAVRVVVGVVPDALLDLGVVEDNPEHPCFSLLEL